MWVLADYGGKDLWNRCYVHAGRRHKWTGSSRIQTDSADKGQGWFHRMQRSQLGSIQANFEALQLPRFCMQIIYATLLVLFAVLYCYYNSQKR